MKISIARRWKLKERAYNQKYKLKCSKKANQTRDFSGKFLFLLSKSNLCTILKFLSRNVCITAAVITINPNLIKQISTKYVLSSRKNKRLIAQSEVRITKDFEECFKRLLKNGLDESVRKKITPIKIISCKICKIKFTKSTLEEHIATAHGNDREDSSRSGDELFIDDDIELMLDNDNDDDSANTSVDDADKTHICLQCPEKFATENLLLSHIDNIHPIKIKNNSVRKSTNNCNSLFPVNKYATGSSTSTPKQKTPNSSFNSSISPTNSSPSTSTITYKRYDSKSSFVCRICSVKFNERNHLNRHITSLHISKVYRCYRCKVSFDKIHLVLKHLRNAHAKYANEVGFIRTCSFPENFSNYQCCFCKFSSTDRQDVDNHLNNEHYEDFEKAETVDEAFSTSPDSLDELLLPETKAKLQNNLNNQTDDDDDEYEDLLTEIKTSPENGKQRKQANDPSFPYRCARCLKRFSRSHYLKKHPCKSYKSESPSSPPSKKQKIEVNGFLRCSNKPCNKVFTDRKHFDEHQKFHKM